MAGQIPLSAGSALDPLAIEVTAAMVIGGAIASRDWAPQHHDHEKAVVAGLKSTIMNTPTQLGLIGRYAAERLGWTGRILQLGCKMKSPIVPGDKMTLEGHVAAVDERPGLGRLVSLAVNFRRLDRVVAEGRALVAIPAEGREQAAWAAKPGEWLEAEECESVQA